MLGRLGMSVGECLNAYKRMAQQAFTPVERWFSWLPRLPAPPRGEFKATSLADAVKEAVKGSTGDPEAVFAHETCVKT